MAKLAVALMILIHVHHSVVMMVGEILQFKVVATAKAAGIPFFEHQDDHNKANGHENGEAFNIEEIDYCSRNSLFPDENEHAMNLSAEFNDPPGQQIPMVYFEIITPPPQLVIG